MKIIHLCQAWFFPQNLSSIILKCLIYSNSLENWEKSPWSGYQGPESVSVESSVGYLSSVYVQRDFFPKKYPTPYLVI